MISPFLSCCVGFSSPDKPKPIYWKVTAVLSMHMHDADSISRLCIHTSCHVWSNCLHAPDLPDLSACHDPQWSAVIWSLIPLLIIIDRHWSPLIFRDLTSFDIARIENSPRNLTHDKQKRPFMIVWSSVLFCSSDRLKTALKLIPFFHLCFFFIF